MEKNKNERIGSVVLTSCRRWMHASEPRPVANAPQSPSFFFIAHHQLYFIHNVAENNSESEFGVIVLH